MRRLTLCGSIEHDADEHARCMSSKSGYVSLADLPPPALPPAVHSKQLSLALLTSSTSGVDDLNENVLSSTDQIRIRRLQDVLLGSIVGVSIALVGWACNQVYDGRLCTTVRRDVGRSEDSRTRCSYLDVVDISAYGAPNIDFNVENDEQIQHLVFLGGWSVLHSMFHVLIPLLLIVSIAFLRCTSPALYRHHAWMVFMCVETIVMFIDGITLREWRESTCRLLWQAAVQRLSIGDKSLKDQWCFTAPFEAFMFLHGLLVLQLTILVLLHPVVFRLWCGSHGSNRQEQNPPTHRNTVLLQEDDIVHFSVYRKL